MPNKMRTQLPNQEIFLTKLSDLGHDNSAAKTHWDTSPVFAPLCGNLQPLMQKQRLLHSNTNKRHTRSSSCWKPNSSEFVRVISDRLVVGTCERRDSTTSPWRLQPTGTLRKEKESNLTAPFWLFYTNMGFTAADPFALGKLSWIQNYLASTWGTWM